MIVITFSGSISLRWQEVRISNWDQERDKIQDSSVGRAVAHVWLWSNLTIGVVGSNPTPGRNFSFCVSCFLQTHGVLGPSWARPMVISLMSDVKNCQRETLQKIHQLLIRFFNVNVQLTQSSLWNLPWNISQREAPKSLLPFLIFLRHLTLFRTMAYF